MVETILTYGDVHSLSLPWRRMKKEIQKLTETKNAKDVLKYKREGCMQRAMLSSEKISEQPPPREKDKKEWKKGKNG